MSGRGPLDTAVLPAGVRSRFLDDVNGLRVHVLEAGNPKNPSVLLLHGFPELAYSWRNVIPGLANAGFHVVAPDLRGYYTLNVVRDAVGVVWALGHRAVAGAVGNDMGTYPAAWSALIRPDIIRTVTLLSVLFVEPPGPPLATAAANGDFNTASAELRELKPPRKQGLHDFPRAYYHCKSADFKANQPHPSRARPPRNWRSCRGITSWISLDDAGDDGALYASPAEVSACRWLTEDQLDAYVTEYERTGFQGALQWYRVQVGRPDVAELQLFAGRKIDIPSMFIAGRSDWAAYLIPGAFERMPSVCTRIETCRFVEDAGHWLQQEQPEAVTDLLVEFLRR